MARPGDTLRYANANYDLLGRLAVAEAGRPCRMLFARMARRCGMRSSFAPETASVSELRSRTPSLSIGFESVGSDMVAAGQVRRSEHAPSGGVISTASDLARWAHCLRSGIAVSKTSFGLLTTPGLNAVRKGHRWGGVSYGFGVQNVAGQHREISHGGYVPGYLSMLVSYPGISLDLIVLENVSRPLGPGGDTFNLHDRLRATVRAALVSGGHVPTALPVSRSGPVRTGKAMPRLPRGAGLNVCPRTVLLPDGEH